MNNSWKYSATNLQRQSKPTTLFSVVERSCLIWHESTESLTWSLFSTMLILTKTQDRESCLINREMQLLEMSQSNNGYDTV